jgi:hypothetical protein
MKKLIVSAVYIIKCKIENDTPCYIGSTINYSCRRSTHKTLCNKKINTPLYNLINNYGGWNNWEISILELYKGDSIKELRKRERYYFDIITNNININRPIITKEEKKIIDEKHNKLKTTCDCGCVIVKRTLKRHLLTSKHKYLMTLTKEKREEIQNNKNIKKNNTQQNIEENIKKFIQDNIIITNNNKNRIKASDFYDFYKKSKYYIINPLTPSKFKYNILKNNIKIKKYNNGQNYIKVIL